MIVMRAKFLERFSATASSWQTVLASCCMLDDGSVLVVGGFSGSGEIDSVERFVP